MKKLLVAFALIIGLRGDTMTTKPLPVIVAKSAGFLTANADTGNVTMFTPTVAGAYRVTAQAVLTTAGTGGTFQFQFNHVPTAASNTNTVSTGTAALTGTINSTSVQLVTTVWSSASNPIQIHVVFGSPTGSPVVSWFWVLERVQ